MELLSFAYKFSEVLANHSIAAILNVTSSETNISRYRSGEWLFSELNHLYATDTFLAFPSLNSYIYDLLNGN